MTIVNALRLALPLVCQSGDPLTAQAVAGALLQLTGEDKREAARALVAQALAAAPVAPIPAKVYVAHYSSGKMGDSYEVFATREAADAHRQSVAKENWADIMDGPMPADPAEAALAYWDRQSDRGEDWLVIEECEVKGAPDPLAALRAALNGATESGLFDRLAGDALHPDVINAFCDGIAAAPPAQENPAPAQGSGGITAALQQANDQLETVAEFDAGNGGEDTDLHDALASVRAALATAPAHLRAIRELVSAAEGEGWDVYPKETGMREVLQAGRDAYAALAGSQPGEPSPV